MNGLLFLLLLLGFSKKDGNAAAPGAPTPTSAAPPGPFAFPQVLPASTVPTRVPSGPLLSPKFILYKPLNQPVIDRAVQILRDPTAKTETIEPDPSGQPGLVRFLKLTTNGKTNVVAFRPNPNFKPATVPA